jgi:hypothetical protein
LVFNVYRRQEVEEVTQLVTPIKQIDIFVTQFCFFAAFEAVHRTNRAAWLSRVL